MSILANSTLDSSNSRREEEALGLTDSHPTLSPSNIYTYLSNLYYARRSKMNPLWNAILVAGYDKKAGESFLGYVDLLGTTYTAPTLATGFGAHIAQPLLREAYEAKAGIDGKGPLLTADEAEALLGECMKVLYYRDARSLNKVGVCVSSAKTVSHDSTKSPGCLRRASQSPTPSPRTHIGHSQRVSAATVPRPNKDVMHVYWLR